MEPSNRTLLIFSYATKISFLWFSLLCLWLIYLLLLGTHVEFAALRQNTKLEVWDQEIKQMFNTIEEEGNQMYSEQWWQEENSHFLQSINHRMHALHRKELKDALDKKLILTSSSTSPFNASREEHLRVMELFSQEVNCLSLRKIGGYGIEGRWLCGFDTYLKMKKNCIVYSFNSNITNLDFEMSFLKETSCKVHLFDPFISKEDLRKLLEQFQNLEHHNLTLGEVNDVDYLFDELRPDLSYIQQRTIGRVMHDLGHSWADVVKLNYEDEDFEKLRDLILGTVKIEKAYHKQLQFPFGQLLFRINTAGDPQHIAQIMIPLMNRGFSILHSEPNLKAEHPWEEFFFSLIHVDPHTQFIIH